jgi:hypothetical protein
MSTHPRRRLALALTLAGTLACGALAGPAMAADGAESPGLTPRKAGGDQHELLTMRKAGGDPHELLTMRKAGGDPGTSHTIAAL